MFHRSITTSTADKESRRSDVAEKDDRNGRKRIRSESPTKLQDDPRNDHSTKSDSRKRQKTAAFASSAQDTKYRSMKYRDYSRGRERSDEEDYSRSRDRSDHRDYSRSRDRSERRGHSENRDRSDYRDRQTPHSRSEDGERIRKHHESPARSSPAAPRGHEILDESLKEYFAEPATKSTEETEATISDDPADYVEEKTHDGKTCWYNVVLQQIRWNPPPSLVSRIVQCIEKPRWLLGRDENGVFYTNTESGRVVRKGESVVPFVPYHMRRLVVNEGDREVDASQTATGKKILQYTEQEMRQRKMHHGSTRSLFDRKKFLKEFIVRDATTAERRDGFCKVLCRSGSGEVITRFTPENASIYEHNPHIQQVFANDRPFVREPQPFTEGDLVVQRHPETGALQPTTPYARRQGEIKTVEHWGQRKLLFSEIEFLLFYGDLAQTIVYAGAAPGNHLNWLSDLFPTHNWVLVDPAPIKTLMTPRFRKIQDYFTDELAQTFAEQDILFICDIRSTDETTDDASKESRVQADMEWQEKWVEIMRPKASMLKFRLPYPPPVQDVEYLDGEIYLPIWGGRTTTETRLVVTQPDKKRTYNNKEYEDYMFHFNTVRRTTYFDHDIVCDGLDHCYDCMAEIFLLRKYVEEVENKAKYKSHSSHNSGDVTELQLTNSNNMEESVLLQKTNKRIVELSQDISKQISASGRSLVLH